MIHRHRDPDFQIDWPWRYDQCGCGARRLRMTARPGGYTPRRYGWPRPVDAHGRTVNDTGWVPEPAGGWPPENELPPLPPKWSATLTSQPDPPCYSDLIVYAREVVDGLDDGDHLAALEAYGKFTVGAAQCIRELGRRQSRSVPFKDFGDVLEPDDA